MNQTIELKGITWGHSRGYTPLVACSQRYTELHPTIQISWKKRTLQEFADFPIEDLVHSYDLLIIDHPWVGRAAATRCVLALDEYLPATYLDDQSVHTVGASHSSYHFDGHQWALAIDAATPVSSYRSDLLQKNQVPLPVRWEEVIALADRGKLAVPGIPIDVLMNFYMCCIAVGKIPFLEEDVVVERSAGKDALDVLRSLYSRVASRMFEYNPIAVAEAMTQTDDYWYCPFAYGYSNYARKGYARHLLYYTDMPVGPNGSPLRSTLGGTGLSISAFSKHRQAALDFAAWIVSPGIQSTLYGYNGGQPGHMAAWQNDQLNQCTQQYFRQTLPAFERAFVRPRYDGYLRFQDHAGPPIQAFLRSGGQPGALLDRIDDLYRRSKVEK